VVLPSAFNDTLKSFEILVVLAPDEDVCSRFTVISSHDIVNKLKDSGRATNKSIFFIFYCFKEYKSNESFRNKKIIFDFYRVSVLYGQCNPQPDQN
jgi:hypothetical protein